jgi:hypothetical protein
MSKSAKKLRAEPSATRGESSAGSSKSQKSNSGSKQSRVISMLQSPNGTTIAAMMKATDWQQHSVRGFLAGVVRKRLKLNLGSKKVDGERIYQILPAGTKKPRQAKQKSS